MTNNIVVTVIGGYLGAGKTTLVNHVLATADQRVAVLVNDFGDINIDAELIERADGDTISLANGCICCSLVDGFASALATIKDLKPRPERLVIEASGVADPASVAAYAHSPGLELDATVVVVDAETVKAKAVDNYVGDTVRAQIASGDVLVLNKVDLLTSAAATELHTWLADHNPDALVAEATYARVPQAVLFGSLPDPHPNSRPNSRPESRRESRPESRPESPPKSAAQHRAEELFESWTWRARAPLRRAAIEQVMADLPDSVVRVKGLLALIEDPALAFVLQRVGKRWTLRADPRRREAPTFQLVFIATRGSLDRHWLQTVLDNATS